MYLSELYGRIGQILRENGDMRVVRHRSLKEDGIIGSGLNNFIDYTSYDFGVLDEYEQKQLSETIIEERKVGQKFIIGIPY